MFRKSRDSDASVFVASPEALSFSLRFITVFDSRLWNRYSRLWNRYSRLWNRYSRFWIRYVVIQAVIPRKPWMFD